MKQKKLTAVKGIQVLSLSEGTRLGAVSRVLLNPRSRRVAALAIKDGIGSAEKMIDRKEIEVIGRDAILVKNDRSAKEAPTQKKHELRSMKELQGTWVTTQEGEHLGTLVDLDVEPDSLLVNELRLADGRRLPVSDPKELVIGPDQVIVPATYKAKVIRRGKKARGGLLGTVFGSDSVEEVRRTLSRALRTPLTAPQNLKGKRLIAAQRERSAALRRKFKSRTEVAKQTRARPVP